jgi:predicted lipoprotein
VLFWFFPLLHVVSLDEWSAKRGEAAESAAEFAAKFWANQLAAARPEAIDAAGLLKALRENPELASEEFGRSVGLSRKYYFFVRGAGRIVSVERSGVGIALDEDGSEADLLLVRGLVFGNAVRDAAGLLNPSDFKNSQYFNDISNELNHLVEAEVLPALDQAEVDRAIRFVGCAEVQNRAGQPLQLKVVPIEILFDAE